MNFCTNISPFLIVVTFMVVTKGRYLLIEVDSPTGIFSLIYIKAVAQIINFCIFFCSFIIILIFTTVIQPNLISVKEVCGKACDSIFEVAGSAAVSIGGCVLDGAGVVAACEVAAGGPENPEAHICEGTMVPLFIRVCVKAVTKIGEFGAKQCKKSICHSEEAKALYNVCNFD